MKKFVLGVFSLALVFASCSDDDDNQTTTAPFAGTLSGGPFTFCVDGTVDNVSGITTDADAAGSDRTFIITDDLNNILGTPPDNAALEGVDFDGAGAGTCFIWYVRHDGTLEGATMGESLDDMTGNFSLSTSISVTRTEVNAGVISGGPFNFTVDGTPDFVTGITLDGTGVGTNSTFVITTDTGDILGLPPTLADLEGVDFDGAGVGVCLIWYLRFEDGLEGAAMGENADDLVGCFALSNPLTVNRS